MCQGLVPRVPLGIGYDPYIWIRPTPSSDKRLGATQLILDMAPSLLAEGEGPPT
jgi:hypothetical protein